MRQAKLKCLSKALSCCSSCSDRVSLSQIESGLAQRALRKSGHVSTIGSAWRGCLSPQNQILININHRRGPFRASDCPQAPAMALTRSAIKRAKQHGGPASNMAADQQQHHHQAAIKQVGLLAASAAVPAVAVAVAGAAPRLRFPPPSCSRPASSTLVTRSSIGGSCMTQPRGGS